MSKKRERNKSEECQCSKCQNKSGKLSSKLDNNPFGINPSQLNGMLGNIDMSQIGNILSAMNKDGFDLNNINIGSVKNMMSGMNGGQNNQELSSIQDMIANMGNSQSTQNNIQNQESTNIKYNNNERDNGRYNKKSRNKENITDIEVDENLEMLISLRKIVSYDKVKFIDKVIELYHKGLFEEK
ncbi:hypothetical protein [Clostridium gasigenes]|uniref:hypothetical protein n=1 Tax=Clostridium gasigenes TaxID=94869 RepID=UPI001C0D762F|nr:hypothetical protein [Clostridium gasigenes]MBU3103698.1 hypothetical protein [Clostridium gasigenes]